MTHLRGGKLIERCQALAWVASGVLLVSSTGCMRSLWNDFFDPSEVGRFNGKPVTNEIRATLGLQDEETELIDATDPLPEDTVAVVKEYQIGPGDTVEVSIHELLRLGTITTEIRKVSELGFIRLPRIGRINVSGMTEQNVEDLLKSKLDPDILVDPIVSVVVREEKQREFTIVGYSARPGPVPIPRADFRMLEAITYAGPMPEEIDKVYVIRQARGARQDEETPLTAPSTEPTSEAAPSASEPARPTSSEPATVPPKPRASSGLRKDFDLLLSDVASGEAGSPQSPPAESSQTASASGSATGQDPVTPEERQELLRALVPGGPGASPSGKGTPSTSAAPTSPAPGSRGPAAPEGSAKELSKWIWLNNEWVELRGTPEQQTAPTATASRPASEPVPTVEWEEVADAGEEIRVISIPIKPLQSGEVRYNIVIRPGDVISVPNPEAGKRYYVMGHIRGPGAYSIPMEGIRLKAAVAAAGGLDPYAWPTRCEIARKIGPDQEQLYPINLDRVFAGTDADVRLKAGDVVNVGTHPLAPFLVAIANGFRLTYGFGFVYDRNFGTIDQYGGKPNPEAQREAEQNARFPQLISNFPGL